jgi:hypothetical protein
MHCTLVYSKIRDAMGTGTRVRVTALTLLRCPFVPPLGQIGLISSPFYGELRSRIPFGLAGAELRGAGLIRVSRWPVPRGSLFFLGVDYPLPWRAWVGRHTLETELSSSLTGV